MSSNKQHSPQHEELLKKQALEQQEVKEVLVFLQKYTKPVATAIVIACAAILIVKFTQAQNMKKATEADAALMNASSADELQAVLDKYASTDAAPMALMALARDKFNAGQVDEAEALYSRFAQEHGDHELAIQAELNAIACTEAKGDLEGAQKAYGDFAIKHRKSFLAPSAWMNQARCQEELGRYEDALIAYDNILADFPSGSWAQTAEANKMLLLNKQQ